VIIGAGKAGTTSLHHYLNQHPQIVMSWPKETNFFTREDYMDSLDWYENCFADRPGMRGEASPAYSNFPRRKHVPQRIRALVPDVKLIYLVRDPIERAESHYFHKYFNRTESRPIEQAFAQITDPLDDPYIRGSTYGLQLEQYLEVFERSQILIVDNRDLKHERDATMSSVFSFLGIEPGLSPEHFKREIKARTKTIRSSQTAARASHSAPAQLGRRLLPVAVREPLFAAARRVLSPSGTVTPTRLSPELREQVAGHFREDAARFRELTGRSFKHWTV
jgi:hypothetical protein